ncbi:hypothetical protein SAMN05880545_1978 [Microbacterium sp. RU33B]|nr:hypothetical protein SAMN05880545_1978 [Microbacterium sp. RU33B]
MVMTAQAADPGSAPAQTIGLESLAIYIALATGAVGAIVGIVVGFIPNLPLFGDLSFGSIAALAAGVVAAAASGVAYWRVRAMPGQEWRLALSPFVFSVNAVGVVLVHSVLAVLSVLAAFLVLGRGFIGLTVVPFWSITLMAVVLGLTAYVVYLSASRLTTLRMSSLLMGFVTIGTLTAMVTTPDPDWWKIHFSHLGTFWSLSSLTFNGTLVAGGLLVTAFAVYVANDMRPLVPAGRLERANSPKTVATLFVVMGIMLAGVGLVPVNVSLLIHNLSASGMAVMYLVLLIGGPWILRGMPRAYFLASWVFLGSLLASLVLFITGFFGLTAFEIIVFALIFGWISVFIRFLGVAGQNASATASSVVS